MGEAVPTLLPVYERMCPNCGREITADRLEKGLPCKECLPTEINTNDVIEIGLELSRRGNLKGYNFLYIMERDFREFSKFFEEKYGFKLSSAQRSWARRLLSNESFSIVAPTGVGKTTLLMAYAAFMSSKRGQKVIYIVPTENLVVQTAERLSLMLGDGVVFYYSSMPKGQRDEMLERIKGGKFSVTVITPGFMTRNFDVLKASAPFDIMVVDDVDSLLRNSKNIDRALMLIGFDEETIQTALKVVQERLELAALEASGRGEERIKQLQSDISSLTLKITEKVLEGHKGQLVIASATGRPKGIKHLIFRELLGFEVGGGTDYLRNVIDSYIVTSNVVGTAVEVVRKLGKGGIIFVSQALGKAYVKELVARLSESNVRAVQALTNSRRAVEKLASGEADVAIGVASRYGTLVRGLDLPEVIRYAVFLGTPAIRVELGTALLSPRRLLRALLFLEERDQGFKGYREKLEGLLKSYNVDSNVVAAAVRGQLEARGRLEELKELVLEASAKAAQALSGMLSEDGQVLRIGTMVLRREGDKVWLYSPDAPSYLQASGRTSRLFRGAMTKGLSVVIDSIKDLIDAMQDRLRWMSQASFVEFSSLKLDEVMRDIEESRKETGNRKTVNIVTELIVVESPTKAKTIANFWGRPARRSEGRANIYETTVVDQETSTVHLIMITASKGHIYDLVVEGSTENNSIFGVRFNEHIEPIYTTIKRCLSCGYQFTEDVDRCPRCGSTAIIDSKGVADTLRKLATQVDRVIIMTDPDREGEKIAWDLYLTMRPYNQSIYRSAFHEVTPGAFMEALRHPGNIAINLVNAQIARRIDDRWIGFTTSQYLWLVMNKNWLGAGRVQTPVLGWIIGRYNEYKDVMGYKVRALLPSGTPVIFYTKSSEDAEEASKLNVAAAITERVWQEDSNPMPPYTTDEMIFDASAKLGYSAELTMKLAQDLFYSGLITYHRTDSTRISEAGMQVARQYLESHGLGSYFKPRSWGTGGAHEAIRPTRPLSAEEVERAILDGSLRVPMALSGAHYRLYQLIFERFLASQMVPATLEKASVTLRLGKLSQSLEVVTSIVKDGYTAITKPKVEGWVQREAGKEYEVPLSNVVMFKGSLVQPYRSGDVVMLMKKKNIGRPSTYAKVIEANIRHGYVIETKRLRFLIPTRLGIEVYKLLSSSPFSTLLDEEASRRLEEGLDLIELGSQDPAKFVLALRDELYRKLSEVNLRLK
jgi:reverse gyrase